MAIFTLPEAQRISDKLGKLDIIDADAANGVTPEALAATLRRELPRSLEVKTGEESAEDDAQDIQEGLGFLNTALLAFAGVALFVGGFIIFNTFSITVAQRTTEFGLLRTLGASRRQILRSVVLEALLIGVDGVDRRPAAGNPRSEGNRGAVQVVRDRPAVARDGARDPHDHRLAAGRDHRHRARRPGAGAARHAGLAAGGDAPRVGDERPARPPQDGARRRGHGDRPGAGRVRPVRRCGRGRDGARLDGARGDHAVRRHLVAQLAGGATHRDRHRLADRAPAGRDGPPRAGERRPQPRSHCGHRRRPDDRPGARDVRDRPGRGTAQFDRRHPRPQLRRGSRAAEQGRLLVDPDGRGRRRQERGRRAAGFPPAGERSASEGGLGHDVRDGHRPAHLHEGMEAGRQAGTRGRLLGSRAARRRAGGRVRRRSRRRGRGPSAARPRRRTGRST